MALMTQMMNTWVVILRPEEFRVENLGEFGPFGEVFPTACQHTYVGSKLGARLLHLGFFDICKHDR